METPATYYPGGSEEVSGVGLTAELCKCQKKKKKMMIYFDSNISSQGENETSPFLKASVLGEGGVLPLGGGFLGFCLPVAAAKTFQVGRGMAHPSCLSSVTGPPHGNMH